VSVALRIAGFAGALRNTTWLTANPEESPARTPARYRVPDSSISASRLFALLSLSGAEQVGRPRAKGPALGYPARAQRPAPPFSC
jgi:hypothetical protein